MQLGLTADDLAQATPLRGAGCNDCGGTGYRGRTGVFEILQVTGELRQALLSSPTADGISSAARRHGITTLRAAALAAAHRGETTYEEVLRVTHVEDGGAPTCPACARALADDMTCCPWDGTAVGRERCTSCDRAVDRDWTTCPYCRSAVVPAAIPVPRRAELPVLS
jgi:type IV pilus assembly protein PilB